MRKIILCTLAIAAVFTLVSCGKNDEKQVRENTQAFLTALVKGDFATVKTLVTPETDAKWGGLLQEIDQTLTPEAKQVIADSKIEIKEVKVTGETAEVLCSTGIPYLISNTTILHFKKAGDKWLIDEPNALVSTVVKEETVVLDTDTICSETIKTTEKIVETKTSKKAEPETKAAPAPAKK